MPTEAKSDAESLAERELNFWWWGLGTFAGFFSVISLVQKLMQVGLAPLPKMILEYYRAALRPFHDLLVHLIPFKLPEWYVDCYILSFLSIAVALRSVVRSVVSRPTDKIELVIVSFLLIVVSALLSLFLFGLFLVFFFFPSALMLALFGFSWETFETKEESDEAQAVARHYMISLLVMIVAAFSFFAWNFQAK